MRTLVVCCDRLPAFLLGCYGELRFRTPHLDELAAEGTLFERCYCDDVDATFPAGPAWRDVRGTAAFLSTAGDWLAGTGAPTDSHESLFLAWSRIDPGAESLRKAVAGCLAHRQISDRDEVLAAALRGESQLPGLAAWENSQVRGAARVLELDAAIGRWREMVTSAQAAARLVLLAARGDAECHPAEIPDWVRSGGEAATHVPAIVWEFAPERAGSPRTHASHRVRSPVTVSDVLRTCIEGTANLPPARDRIEHLTLQARSIRTPRWRLVQRLDLAADAEPEVQLFHLPEDPWSARDVSGEYLDLVDRYLATGVVPTES